MGSSDWNEELAEALRRHGVPARVDGDHVSVAGSPIVLRGRTTTQPSAGAFIARVDLEVDLPDGRTLVESSASPGDDAAAAAGAARAKLAASSLHVLLASLFDAADDGQVERDAWTIDGVAWTVFIGP